MFEERGMMLESECEGRRARGTAGWGRLIPFGGRTYRDDTDRSEAGRTLARRWSVRELEIDASELLKEHGESNHFGNGVARVRDNARG